MELLERKMNRALDLLWISTKRQQIAKLATEDPARVLTSLAHHIDLDWLQAAYELTRKDGATGVDRQTAQEYANVSGSQNPPPYGETRDYSRGGGAYFLALAAAFIASRSLASLRRQDPPLIFTTSA